MNSPPDKPAHPAHAEAATELRRRAEARLRRQRSAGGGPRTEAETARLIHELEVHQTELELQNEELRTAQERVEAGLALYADLYDFAPTGYLTLDRAGVIGRVNLAGARMLGTERSQFLKRRFSRFVAADDRGVFADFLWQVFTKEAKQACEVTLAVGGQPPLVVQVEGMRSASGEECLVMLVDISERKRAEVELRESEARFRALADSGQALIWTAGLDKKCNYFNQPWLDFTGRTLAQELGDGWVEGVHPEDLKRCVAIYSDSFDRRERFSMDYRLRRADGTYAWIQDDGTPRYSQAGEFLGYIGHCLDITERRRLTESERQEQALTAAIIAAVPGTFFVLDAAGRIVRWNNYLRDEIVGQPDNQVAGTSALDTIHPDDRALIQAKLANVLQTGAEESAEARTLLRGGPACRWQWFTGRRMIVGGEPFVVGFGLDLTARKQAEEALRESEQRFRLLAEGAEDFVTLFDAEWREVFHSPAYFRRTGWTPADLDARDFTTRVHPGDLAAVKEARTGVAAGQAVTYEHRCRCKDGAWICLETHAKPLPGPEGQTQYFFAARDITGRKQAELSLQELNAELEQRVQERTAEALDLYHNAPCGYHSVGPDGMVLQMNDTELGWLGYAREEVEGRLHLADLMAPASAALFAQRFHEFREQDGRGVWEWEMRCRDDSTITFLVNAEAVRDAAGRFLRSRSAVLNITERKQAEREQEKTLRWQQGINALQQSLLAPTPLAEQLKAITDGIVALFGADFCRIWLIRPGDLCAHGCVHAEAQEGPHVCQQRDRCLHLLASSGRYTHLDGRNHGRVPFGAYKIGRVAAGAEHKFLTNDAQHEPRVHDSQWARDLGLVAFAGYQLRIPGAQTLGVLALFSRHPHSPVEDALLDGLSSTLAQIIHRTETEAARRESEVKFRMLFESSRDAIIITTATSDALDCNPAAVTMFGYPDKATLLARGPAGWSPARQPDGRASRAGFMEVVLQSLAAGSYFGEWLHQRADGTPFPAEITLSVAEIRGERVLHGIVRDISERKQAEVQLRQLQSAVEQSPTVVVITDLKANIEYVNPRFAAQTGYAAAEVLGKNPRLLQSGHHSREFYRELWQMLLAGQTWRGEFCNLRKDGVLFWESAAIAPLHDRAGRLTHFVAIKEDITARRHLAEELRQARDAAEAANRAKSTFLANMSHEIRTPMNAILGFAQILLRDAKLSPLQLRQLTTIHRSGEHLMDIINGVLEMARIESGRISLNPAPFDLQRLLDDLERMFSLRGQAKQLRILVERDD